MAQLLYTIYHMNVVTILFRKQHPAARYATLKAGCGCALPLDSRVKSHPPLKLKSFKETF